jgi:tRNA A-37 threonylcarbamoyl transferase component Bud32
VTRAILKESRRRTVELAGARVVKRFHDPNPLKAPRDWWRARHEHRVLSRLHDLGVHVPAPLAMRRVGRTWQVEMQAVPTDLDLAQWIRAGRFDGPEGPYVARRLGRLLAAVHAAGLDHEDLHAENVLLDATLEPWLIDFHQARLRHPLSARRIRAHLVQAAARAREALPAAFRARVYLAWRAALPAELRATLSDRDTLLAEVEAAARGARRDARLAMRARWLREGGTCRVQRVGDRDVLVVRTLDEAQAAELAAGAAEGSTEVALPSGTAMILRGADEQRFARRGCLVQQGVPAAAPLALARDAGRPWAAYLLPPAADAPNDPVERARGLGALLGALHDRGWSVPGLAPRHLVHAAGGPHLVVNVDPVPFDPAPFDGGARFDVSPELGPLPPDAPDARCAFVAAYLAAHRGAASERRRLARELDA